MPMSDTPAAASPPAAAGLPQAAAALAYAGALPLVVAAILVWFAQPPLSAQSLAFMAAYGIALLAFFGGVRWGVAVMRPEGPTFANVAGAAAPLALALPLILVDAANARLWVLVIALPVLLFDDLRATQRGSGAPEWYLGVRLPLTVLMEISLLAALAHLLTHGAPA